MYDVVVFAAVLCAVIIIPAFLFVSLWADRKITQLTHQLRQKQRNYDGLLRDFEGMAYQYHVERQKAQDLARKYEAVNP